jgi:hypothetical protein
MIDRHVSGGRHSSADRAHTRQAGCEHAPTVVQQAHPSDPGNRRQLLKTGEVFTTGPDLAEFF